MPRIERGTQRAASQPYVQSLASSRLSKNAIYNRLKEVGLSYRRTDVLHDIDTYRAQLESYKIGVYAQRNRYPTSGMIVNDERNLKDRYQHLVQIIGTHEITGETITKLVTVGEDKLSLVGDIEGRAMDIAELNRDMYNVKNIIIAYQGTRRRIE